MTRRGAEVGVSFLKSRSPRRKTISPALRRRRSSGTSSLRRACCFGVRSSETDISRPRRAVHDLRTLNLSAGELSLIRNLGDSGFREFRSVSTSTMKSGGTYQRSSYTAAGASIARYYRKRFRASYIVREVRSVRERERYRERDIYRRK